MRIDLHVHSEFSRRPSEWILKKLGCAESYTRTADLYRIAKQRGMQAVTITDHNTIDGALEIAHLPDVFVSCEVTTYFPQDGCKLHVLVWRITEEQFREIDRLRPSVFELAGYLNREGIPHALAHPFYAVNDRLTVQHIEMCLLLFRLFEMNGNRDDAVNGTMAEVMMALTAEDIDRLAETYGFAPSFDRPWEKGFVGGSDDHSSLNIGHTYTEVPSAGTVDEFLAGVVDRQGRPKRRSRARPINLAHTVYGVAYQFYKSKFGLERYYEHSTLMQFFDRVLQVREGREPRFLARVCRRWRARRLGRAPAPDRAGLIGLLQYEAQRLVDHDPDLRAVLGRDPDLETEPDRRWARFVNEISNRMLGRVSRHLVDEVAAGNPFDIFHAIGSAGALYALLAPYFIAYAIYCTDRRFSEAVRRRFEPGRPAPVPRVGVFTDTFEEINGVSHTWQRLAKLARRTGRRLTVVTCSTDPVRPPGDADVRYFQPVAAYPLPEYPEQKLYIPPLLEMMEFCYERGFTHLHAATPGPLGLAALAIARVMKLPFSTTYHTAVPQYARVLTGDTAVEDLAWRLILWFYDQSEVVFSSSVASAEELMAKGVAPAKVRIMPRGVDTEVFSPETRTARPDLPQGLKLLYVGRISREKNLSLLARVFRQVCVERSDVHLVVVGDGPYLAEMRQALADLPCVFTGYLEGEALAAAYAAADLFVFPSTTDTFGNVVLEAQACGVPVIVTDKGGPQENLVPGETGLVVQGDDPDALLRAIRELLDDPERRKAMGDAAVRYAQTRSVHQAFERYWRFYEQPTSSSVAADREWSGADLVSQFAGLVAGTEIPE